MFILASTSFFSSFLNKSSISFFDKSWNLLLNKCSAKLTAFSYSSFPCKKVMISLDIFLCDSLNSGCSLLFIYNSYIYSFYKKL